MGSDDIFWVDNQLCQLLDVPDIQNSNVKQLVYLCSQKNVDRYVALGFFCHEKYFSFIWLLKKIRLSVS